MRSSEPTVAPILENFLLFADYHPDLLFEWITQETLSTQELVSALQAVGHVEKKDHAEIAKLLLLRFLTHNEVSVRVESLRSLSQLTRSGRDGKVAMYLLRLSQDDRSDSVRELARAHLAEQTLETLNELAYSVWRRERIEVNAQGIVVLKGTDTPVFQIGCAVYNAGSASSHMREVQSKYERVPFDDVYFSYLMYFKSTAQATSS